MSPEEALESLKLKFSSGNEIDVERATILKKEFDALIPLLQFCIYGHKYKKYEKD